MKLDTTRLKAKIEARYRRAMGGMEAGNGSLSVQRKVVSLDTERDRDLTLVSDVEYLARRLGKESGQ